MAALIVNIENQPSFSMDRHNWLNIKLVYHIGPVKLVNERNTLADNVTKQISSSPIQTLTYKGFGKHSFQLGGI